MYIFIHRRTHGNMYVGVLLLSLWDTLSLIPLNLPWGDGSGCGLVGQGPGAGVPLASVGLELSLRKSCLERDAKSGHGSRCPKVQQWIFPKSGHGSRFPMALWQSVVRGNVPSDGRVERYVHAWRSANGGGSSLGSGHAVNYTDQHSTRSSPRLTPAV